MKQIAFSLLLLILVSVSVGAVWFRYQMKNRLGAKTAVIDPSPYFEDYAIIGIRNVNILDSDSGRFIPNQNVLLENGFIRSIDSTADLSSSVKYMNGTGKYLIPGLVDSHVHLKHSKNDLYLYLANGVTSVWEMFGHELHLGWKEEKQQGSISPDLFIATQKFGSEKGIYHWGKKYLWWHINVTSESAARKEVQKRKQMGYDAIKIGSFTSRNIFDVLIDEAQKQNIPVLGHIPLDVGLDHVYTSGFVESAHVEELTKNLMEEFGGVSYDDTEEFLSYLAERADSVAIQLRDNNIAVSTTIWLMESFMGQKFDIEKFLSDIELEYANPTLVEGKILRKIIGRGWLPGNNTYEDLDIKNDSERRAKSERWWKMYIEAIHIMTVALNNNGVTILAGTDANATCAVAGFSLHDELESLVHVGLSNEQALRSATNAPAEWTNTKSGVIKEGYQADLLLLSKNPLTDIGHTRSIETVFTGEYYLTKDKREELLSAIRATNDASRTIDIAQWK